MLRSILNGYVSKLILKYCEENFLQEIDTNNIAIDDIVLRNKNCHYNSYQRMLTSGTPQVKVILWSENNSCVHYINKTHKGNYSDITLGLAGWQYYTYYIVEELPVENKEGHYRNMGEELYEFKYDILKKISPNKYIYKFLKWYNERRSEIL